MSWSLRTAPGVTLCVHGPATPARPVAVVLHGAGSTADFARRCLAGPLADLGYDVVAPDLRGHGSSTPMVSQSDHSIGHHVADLCTLASVVDVRLVAGISLGAEVALRWATAAPAALDGLLLCLPAVAGPQSAPAQANRAAADELAERGIVAVLDRISAADSALPWVVEEVRASWPRHAPGSLVAALRAVAAEAPLAAPALGTVDVPVGVAAVDDDAGHPVDIATRLVSLLPRAALEMTRLADLSDDRSRLGRAAVRALRTARSRAQRT